MLITILFTCNMWGTKQFHISWYYLPSKAFSLRGKWKRSCAVGSASKSQDSPLLLPVTAGLRDSSRKPLGLGTPRVALAGAEWGLSEDLPLSSSSGFQNGHGGRETMGLLQGGHLAPRPRVCPAGQPLSHSTLATSGQWVLPLWLQRLPAASQAQRVKQVPGPEKRDWPWVRAARPSQLLGFVWRVRRLLVPELHNPAACGIGRRVQAGETSSITTIVTTTTSSTTTGSSSSHCRRAAAPKLGKGFECGTLAEPEPSLSQGLRPPASFISPLSSHLPARRWERKWATRVLGRGGRNHQLPRRPPPPQLSETPASLTKKMHPNHMDPSSPPQ